jgi:hypothetical protein
MDNWRPIETAPKDVECLLYCPDLGNDSNIERVEVGYAVNTKAGSAHSWATHWMPLPKPPKEGE